MATLSSVRSFDLLDIASHGSARHGMAWYGMASHGMVGRKKKNELKCPCSYFLRLNQCSRRDEGERGQRGTGSRTLFHPFSVEIRIYTTVIYAFLHEMQTTIATPLRLIKAHHAHRRHPVYIYKSYHLSSE